MQEFVCFNKSVLELNYQSVELRQIRITLAAILVKLDTPKDICGFGLGLGLASG